MTAAAGDRSRAEVEALLLRALRGARVADGAAVEMAHAVAWYGGASDVAAVADGLGRTDFAAIVSDADRAEVEGLPVEGGLVGLLLQTRKGAPQAQGRFDLDAGCLAVLHEWAARTYVPETEASRSGGAGAGANDGD
ncbi:MAG: hypothetical protein ACU0CI_06530 [Shimia sp.]